jgi:hypothetical protein
MHIRQGDQPLIPAKAGIQGRVAQPLIRHARLCAGHPRLRVMQLDKARMAGT